MDAIKIREILKRNEILNLNTDKLLEDLKQYLEYKQEIEETLREKLNNYNKDDEIQKLKEEIEDVRRKSIAMLTEEEENQFKNFREEHYNTCKGSTDLILSFHGIGRGIDCRCTKCGKIKDITDYSSW